MGTGPSEQDIKRYEEYKRMKIDKKEDFMTLSEWWEREVRSDRLKGGSDVNS